jgi:transcriptional regulator with XRE-family HTH domain
LNKRKHIKQLNKVNYNRIKSVLAEKNITNIELAEELQVADETISSWCTNSAQPSIKTLFKIALFLKVDAGDLLVKINDFKAE